MDEVHPRSVSGGWRWPILLSVLGTQRQHEGDDFQPMRVSGIAQMRQQCRAMIHIETLGIVFGNRHECFHPLDVIVLDGRCEGGEIHGAFCERVN